MPLAAGSPGLYLLAAPGHGCQGKQHVTLACHSPVHPR